MNPSDRVLSPAAGYEAGVSLYSSGRPLDALATLDQLLQTAPSDAQALRLAAICLNQLNQGGDAKHDESVIEDHTELAEAYNDLGVWFYQRNELAQAEHAFRTAF